MAAAMKVVFLGATRGMGRALARLLAERGDTLFLLGRDPEELARSAADLQARGPGQALATIGHGAFGLGDEHQLRLGYLANITNAAALVGKDRGIFARGLPGTTVTVSKFTTGTEATAALLSGSLDASYLGMGPVITAQSRAPGQLTVVAGAGEAGAVLVVRKGSGIRALADLRGKRVGFPGYGNTQDLALQWELAQVGLTAGRGQDVHTVRVANADLRTAFERGALDAALSPEPWGSALVDQGLATVLLPADRIMGVETGGCPHTAIREDCSINLEAIDRMLAEHPNADIVFVESGGDNLAATFSPELSDLTIYVIDVAAGEKIPRKGGPGITKSDLFVINKTDLAPHVGADLEVMKQDTARMRPDTARRPWVMTNLKTLFDASQLTSEQVTVGFTLFAAAWLGLTAWTAWRHERARRLALAIREAAETEWSI